MPFQHNGLEYARLSVHTLKISQKCYLEKIPEAKLVGDTTPTRPLDPVEVHSFRSLLCSLLWVMQTYINAAAEVPSSATEDQPASRRRH